MACKEILWQTMCENSFQCTSFGFDINCNLQYAIGWILVFIIGFVLYKTIASGRSSQNVQNTSKTGGEDE